MTDHVLLSVDGSIQFDVVGTDYVAKVAPRARVMESASELAATEIPDAGTGTLSVVTAGFASPGDRGGCRYVFAASEPAIGGVQSLDGAWWVPREAFVTPQMFGAAGDGATDDRAAVQACFDFAEAMRVAGLPTAVRITANHGLAGTVYVVATNLMAQGVSRRAGFKALSATGYVCIGDSRNLASIRKSPHCTFVDIGFDAAYIAPFAMKLDYDIQAPKFENCTFEKATLAGALISPNVTEFVFIGCIWRLLGVTAASSVVKACDAALSYGNGAFSNCTLGGCSGWGLRQMGTANNPYVSAPPVEENHANIMGGRINSCYEGFILNESQRVQHVALSAAPPAFIEGEVISGGSSGATGRFVMSVGSTLYLIDLTDTAFTVGETVSGAQSSLSGVVASNAIGTQNQGGGGTIRTNVVGVYLENPGNGSASDGGSDPTQTGGRAIIARGRKSAIALRGGTKHQIRAYAEMVYADFDARIDYWGPNSLDAQLIGDTPRGRIAGNGIGGDGTARVIIHAWPQRLISVGNALTTDEQREDPASSWAGMIGAGPHFEGRNSSGLGVIPPRMHLLEEVIDGTTAALPSVATSRTSLSTSTVDGDAVLVATRTSGEGASNFRFAWAPDRWMIDKWLMFVVLARMRQVGAGFGGTGEPPAPRLRVQNPTTPANLWPVDATSTTGQSIPAPGAGNLTKRFTMGVGFVPRSTQALEMTVNISTRIATFDDELLVIWGRIYEIGPSAGL